MGGFVIYTSKQWKWTNHGCIYQWMILKCGFKGKRAITFPNMDSVQNPVELICSIGGILSVWEESKGPLWLIFQFWVYNLSANKLKYLMKYIDLLVYYFEAGLL